MKTIGFANEELFHAPGHGWYRTKEEALKHVREDQIEHFYKLEPGKGFPDLCVSKDSLPLK